MCSAHVYVSIFMIRLSLRQRWEQQTMIDRTNARGGSGGGSQSSSSSSSSSSSAKGGSSNKSTGAAGEEGESEVVLCSPDKPKMSMSRTPSDAFDDSRSSSNAQQKKNERGLLGPLGRPNAAPLKQLLQQSDVT